MEDVAIERSFWRGKSVFVTGHTGFKGSWLTLWLTEMGARVFGYSLDAGSRYGLFPQLRIGRELHTTYGDVRDRASLGLAMAAAEPEIAFHLAAQPLVRASYRDPAYTLAVNVMGTVHFLDALRANPSVRAAIVVTSDKCYAGQARDQAYREGDPMGGRDPYSCSKGCVELVTASYRDSFFRDAGAAIATVRAGNVIGGGDWAQDRLLPDLVRAFSCGRILRLRYPQAVRPWQYVLDPLHGYLMLAHRLWQEGTAYVGAWNFGPNGVVRTVEEMVRYAAKLWGEGARWEVEGACHPYEAQYLGLDCSKARRQLGWAPLLAVDGALDWTLAWYRAARFETTDMHAFSAQQIENFEGLVGADQAPAQTLGRDGA